MRGEAELIMGRRLPWDAELSDADRNQAGDLELAPQADSMALMPADQKAALQRYTRATAALRFLDHPLAALARLRRHSAGAAVGYALGSEAD